MLMDPASPLPPLTAAELEERLDEFLDPILSSRRTAAGLAWGLAGFDRAPQEFALGWVDIIAKTNAEMAYRFALHAPKAMRLMDAAAIEGWIIRAMDVYDRQGLYPGCAAFEDVAQYAEESATVARGAAFHEVAGVIELFVRGLSGRRLKVEIVDDAAGEAFTDTATLYLPARIARFAARADNVRLYKAIAAHLWAQTWFGTFRSGTGEYLSLLHAMDRFPEPARATRLFHALETIRLNARIAEELPGLHREMQELQARTQPVTYPAAWAPVAARLQRPQATVFDTYEAVRVLYGSEPPPSLCYQGELLPERVDRVMRARIAREKEEFRGALGKIAHEVKKKQTREVPAGRGPMPQRFELKQLPDPNRPGRFSFDLGLDGKRVEPSAEIRALMESILQDLGGIPEDYLEAAGDGDYRRDNVATRAEDVARIENLKDGTFRYDEWDYKRRHYRKDWCALRELDVHPNDAPFVQQTLDKHRGLLAQLRKTFEALRGEDKFVKRQTTGDDIDLDAFIEAHADMHHGMELSERLFVKRRKLERDIAVLLLVDMSGSTKGWINDAERESLVLLCEVLEILGDRYAIYGFSGMTRQRCEFYRVKRFEEPYTDLVRRRITGMTPQDYTRMGVVIRHATRLISNVEARAKLLITLSDGKPDDYDGYRGDYGIEDTRQALLEARYAGVHPFCITIDEAARDYLPHMYGAVNWTLVDDVRRLPVKVSDIYRRLTL